MYIDEIFLENIRGFEKLQFSLQRPDKSYAGWTVFVGDNGSGKSTLLKSLALCLVSIDTVRVLEPNIVDWIRHGKWRGLIKVQIKPSSDDQFDKLENDDNIFSSGWGVSKGNSVLIPLPDSPYYKNDKIHYEKVNQSVLSPDAKGWFFCGYGPFRRIFGITPESKGIEKRFFTLFSESASLSEVNTWLKELDYQRLLGEADAAQQLETIIQLLNDDLLPNSVKVDNMGKDGIWLIDSHGDRQTWGGISDGYRSVLSLICDMMRHLFSTFDHTTLIEKKNDRLVIKANGVVLIDEIDAHLHPEWQIKIGFWLKERFPNIQFLVTTHSPLICQAADENGLFVLPSSDSADIPRAISADEYKKIIASKSDTILLSSLFGLENTRSEKIVEMTMRYSDLIAKKQSGIKLSKAEVTELEQLEFIVEVEDE
jgi:energy-coupling factor transporter ATP-binding protein EcfA2